MEACGRASPFSTRRSASKGLWKTGPLVRRRFSKGLWARLPSVREASPQTRQTRQLPQPHVERSGHRELWEP